MFGKPGIGGRLFLAFAGITALSLISGLVGWVELRRVAETQALITRTAMPAATEAQGIAEVSARLIARAPLLTGATSEATRQREAAVLFAGADELRKRLGTLGHFQIETVGLDALKRKVERLIENLGAQNDLVARRLKLATRAEAMTAGALAAAVGLADLSETLVSNASSGATAVISSLYGLIEDKGSVEAAFDALDRLVEWDLYLMERMFELRLRSSQVGLLLNQLAKAGDAAGIDWIETRLDRNVQILARRVNSIDDPVRRRQAKVLFGQLTADTASNADDSVFGLRRSILATVAEIDRLARANQRLSTDLGAMVRDLVGKSRDFSVAARNEAEQATRIGLATLLTATLVSLLAAGLIVWLYVERNVARRLGHLAAVMGDLARGKLDVAVETSGNDELTRMARTIRFFKQEAIRKRELERERALTEIELRRHRNELQQLVDERTQQLSDANARLRQEVEAHATARARAEAASHAKSEFLATMSHEIRTPMNGMLGMLRVLGGGGLAPDQRAKLALVESSGQTLLAILNDILDYSKIESGHIEIEKADFDLDALIEGILSLMRPRAEEKGIALTVERAPEVPARLAGDPGKLRQILFNLIGNGIKFTDGGRVALSVRRQADDDAAISLRFAVADTGIGLPEAARDKVFEVFFQHDASISRRYGGTGLGLAICARLVAAMGGDIGVDSTLGAGSLFWFTLPFDRAAEAPRRTPATRRPAATPERLAVLVVEDNEVNQLVASAFLEDMGHAATIAGDGGAALAAVATEDFDLVLMDIGLPGMDGVEVTRRIRALPDPAKRDVPIIALSAHVFTSEIDAHLEAGMNDFVGKPVSPERLAEAIDRVVGRGDSAAAPVPEKMVRETLSDDFQLLGATRAERLVAVFLDSMPKGLGALDAAIAAGDATAVAFAAHRLKSAAGSLGLAELADRLDAIEAAARAGAMTEIARLQHGCDALYRRSARLVEETWTALAE